MDCVLGIDTSNYTTSLCALRFQDGQLVAEARKLLPVKMGQRGLRQSDALFFHVGQLPLVMQRLMAELRQNVGLESVSWKGVGVSVRPRPFASSYMPVFHAGHGFAETFALAIGIPVIPTSHQEGHLAAAQYFMDFPRDESFLAVHLSGGTSDVLWVKPTRFGYTVRTIGEGADLHAGQFVDRVGVALQCPFPAGPSLEVLAKQAPADSSFRIPSSSTGAQLSFSGPCSAALRAIEQGVAPEVVAFAVETCIANSVARAVTVASAEHPLVKRVVVAGGVASNQHIQGRVQHRLKRDAQHLIVEFAPARYASDNALGPAAIARQFLLSDA